MASQSRTCTCVNSSIFFLFKVSSIPFRWGKNIILPRANLWGRTRGKNLRNTPEEDGSGKCRLQNNTLIFLPWQSARIHCRTDQHRSAYVASILTLKRKQVKFLFPPILHSHETDVLSCPNVIGETYKGGEIRVGPICLCTRSPTWDILQMKCSWQQIDVRHTSVCCPRWAANGKQSVISVKPCPVREFTRKQPRVIAAQQRYT